MAIGMASAYIIIPHLDNIDAYELGFGSRGKQVV